MPDPAIFALTVRQPWAWAIAHGGKPVENRVWKSNYRGLLAIHAGARSRWDQEGQRNPVIRRAWVDTSGEGFHTLSRGSGRITFGAVIAVAFLADVHLDADCADLRTARTRYCSEWAMRDSYHWALASIRPLREPVPCVGRLSLWRMPPEVESAVRAQLTESVHRDEPAGAGTLGE